MFKRKCLVFSILCLVKKHQTLNTLNILVSVIKTQSLRLKAPHTGALNALRADSILYVLKKTLRKGAEDAKEKYFYCFRLSKIPIYRKTPKAINLQPFPAKNGIFDRQVVS